MPSLRLARRIRQWQTLLSTHAVAPPIDHFLVRLAYGDAVSSCIERVMRLAELLQLVQR